MACSLGSCERSSGLCGDLEEQDGVERRSREGGVICVHMADTLH